jgi:Asp/Glu/hydantoin racemase
MITILFKGITIDCYQDPALSYSVDGGIKKLLSGDQHVSLGTKVNSFPRSYECYTESFSTISALMAVMGQHGTLTVDSANFLNCYIYPDAGISDIKEVVRGSGKWKYTIKFGQGDVF